MLPCISNTELPYFNLTQNNFSCSLSHIHSVHIKRNFFGRSMGTRDNITRANTRESSTVHSPLSSHWTIDTTTSANCAVVVSKTSAIGGECRIGCLLMEPCRCKQRWRQLVKVSWTIKEFQETMNSVSIQRFGDRYSFCWHFNTLSREMGEPYPGSWCVYHEEKNLVLEHSWHDISATFVSRNSFACKPFLIRER